MMAYELDLREEHALLACKRLLDFGRVIEKAVRQLKRAKQFDEPLYLAQYWFNQACELAARARGTRQGSYYNALALDAMAALLQTTADEVLGLTERER